MSTIVRGDGPSPCRIFLCGERPGYDESIELRPFVGPAGRELWHRLWRVCKIDRDDVYVTNLVKTFSTRPPSRAEINHWKAYLYAELIKVRPSIIVTIGYHAARFFLPQFASLPGDYFHGLPFEFQYGRLTRRTAIVVPVVHSAAALRQPERYQQQLVDDLTTVRRVIDGEITLGTCHRAHKIVPYRTGLAQFGKEGLTLGVDSEFDHGRTRVVTISADRDYACAVDIDDQNRPSKFLRPALLHAKRLISHSAKAEYHALASVGIDLTLKNVRVDDTMLKAYLLRLPQSLKVLAFRELGWEMDAYLDLVTPIDEARVRLALEDAYAKWTGIHRRHQQNLKRVEARHRDAGIRAEKARALATAALGKAPKDEATGQEIPRRALTSLKRFVGRKEASGPDQETGADEADPTASEGTARAGSGDAESGGEGEEKGHRGLRSRWSDSVFAPLIALPQEAGWSDLPQGVKYEYALTDAIAHRELDAVLTPRIKRLGLSTAYEIDRAVLPFLVRNERIGLAVDAKRMRRLSAEFADEYDQIVSDIAAHAGHDVNPLSGPDVSHVLFNELDIVPTRKTPSGKHYTTQDKYLKARRGAHAIIPLILDARQINKYRGTYTEKLPSLLVTHEDGSRRYHPDWRYTRTATGRLAEEVILLVPKHSQRAKKIRDCFYATDGHLLVSVDLSQIELRAMAHLSEDRELVKAFRSGVDLHSKVAHELLGAPKKREDQDESKHRLPIKTFHFSIINGTTEYGLLDQLHEQGLLSWTLDGVRDLLKEWFILHSGVAHYWTMQIAKARRQGYVTDLFGARRYIAGVHSKDERIRSESERQCLCPIQMTADRISKIWNKKIWRDTIVPRIKANIYCEPWIRVHDDTTVEVDRKHAKSVAREMLASVPSVLSIPTTAEAKSGERWGSLH